MKSSRLVDIEFKGLLMPFLSGVFVIFVMMMIFGCSESGRKLIGAWNEYSQYEYGNKHAEFFKDGSCYFEGNNERVAGHWSALEDDRIKVDVNQEGYFGGSSTMTLFVVVTEDELILDGGGNNKETYVRDGSRRATEIQSKIKIAVEEREIRIEAEKRAQAEKLEAERLAREKQQETERAAHASRQEANRAYKAGVEALGRGLYAQGMAELERSWGLGKVLALNDMAWHFATCKDANQHDGKRAVELAEKIINLKPNDRNYLDTLAAAYARDRQFEKAISTQIRALSLGSIDGGEERLKLYREGQPYQEK